MTKNYISTIFVVFFTTIFSFSQTFNGTTGPITDNNCATTPNTFSTTVTGATSSNLAHIDIDITHTYIGDISLTLTHVNSGTSVVLVNPDATDNGDNYTNTVFTDGSNTSITAGVAPYRAGFLPENSLSTFNGLSPNSEWTLTVCDAYEFDTGTLNSWSITFAGYNENDNFIGPLNLIVPGEQFSDDPITANNTGATASEINDWTNLDIPTGCGTIDNGGYFGGDLWFESWASNNGTITIETAAVPGSDVTDTAIAIYDTSNNLIACNDDKSGSDFFSKIEIGGLNPGSPYIVRVWEFNNNNFGDFQISAYANDTYVPDDNFENYLETHDASGAVVPLGDPTSMGNGTVNDNFVPTSKIDTVTHLNVSVLGISDLTGIEDFTALTVLECDENNLTTINVSNNINLTDLHLTLNSLTAINVDTNINLETLDIRLNNITNLNLSHNLELKYLWLSFNNFGTLNVTNNSALETLDIQGINISELDVSNNVSLTYLDCSSNNLEFLDLTNNVVLNNLGCFGNQLSYLNVANGNNTNFVDFRSHSNPNLSCIKVDDAAYSTTNWTNIDPASSFSEDCGTYVPDDNFEQALIDLTYDVGPLDNYVPTANINTVTVLYVNNKNISDLTGIEDFSSLTTLECYNNNLENLNLSSNTALINLNCTDNSLLNLNLSNNLLLESLYCYDNNLEDLDVSINLALIQIDCSSNPISNLDVSQHTALSYLVCHSTNITSLDVSENINLTQLHCYNNNLSALNLANSNNTNMTHVNVSNNTNLHCIEVDDVSFSNTNWATGNFFFDSQSYFSIDCNFNDIPEKAYTLNVGHDFEDQVQIGDNTIATASELIDPSIPLPTACGGGFDSAEYNGDDVWYAVSIPDDGSVIIETEVNDGSITDTGLALYSGVPGSLVQMACNDDIDVGGGDFFSMITLTGQTPNDLIYFRAWSWQNNETGTFKISAYRNPAISTYVPDDNFENYLETHDASGTVVPLGDPTSMGNGIANDGFVLNNRINTVTSLNVGNLSISDLTGIEGFTALNDLMCSLNNLTELDVSNNTALTNLICDFNNLTELNVSENIALTNLGCGYNNLTELDVSTNTALSVLGCDNNSLTVLNLANGNNLFFSVLRVNTNPGLTCVTVDNQSIADNWNNDNILPSIFFKDYQTQFSTNCGEVVIEAKAYLQGAFLNPRLGEEAFMRDDLRANGYLPTTSPYADNATVIGTPFSTIGTDAIVDWVWVELRDDTDNTIIIEGQSALLQRDGDIVAPDGVSPLVFSQQAKHYNVVLKHRNHVGVITSLKQPFPLNQTQNYMNGSTTVLGANALVNMNGTFALWTGDVGGDSQIKFSGSNNDANAIKDGVLDDPANGFNSATFTSSGYLNYDLNMDGNGKFSGANNDGNIVKDNILSHPGNGFNSPAFTINSYVPED
ncbi:proprotein convertase P-domain-containing protein [Xanthomarina sp. GH4-25]|uniref:proprotein convertase P-domain-containing protein n=1 Tax=Xanthomarina sp. GH4-25 TaxID=3349335 RepID=UPI003877AF92